MSKKKICLVLPTLTGGGMERVISELANYFSSLGHEIHIICLVNHIPFYKINDNISLYQPKAVIGAKRNLIYWVKILFFLRSTILKINPDTVLSIPQGYSNLTIFALLYSNIPVYVSERNSPNKPVSFKSRVLRKIFYPLATGIIAQTQFAKDKLKKSGIKNDNIIVIPNPLKKMTYYPKEADSKVVLNIGRLVMEKNQCELVKIFSEIKCSDWKLHIIGSGPLREQLLDQIKELEMTDRIFISDSVSNIDKELSKGDIFAFTSIYEGFPNSLNEAMAYPLACIAYDCIAGPGEMIKNGVNGYLVKMKDKDDYKQKLEQLMMDKSIRDKFSMESKMNRDKFSLDIIGQQYLNFILNT